VAHESVVEAAVVGRPDDLTGQAIVAFVIPGRDVGSDEDLKQILQEHVAAQIGKLARPAEIRITDALPKTRSGKIMRRLLRDIAAGVEITQDTSTIEDQEVLVRLRGKDQ
jgi:acetyl-CoA synthetase